MSKSFYEMYYGTSVETTFYQSTLVTEVPHYDIEQSDAICKIYNRLDDISDESILFPSSKFEIYTKMSMLDVDNIDDDTFREIVRKENFELAMDRYYTYPLEYVDSLIDDHNFIRNEYLSVIDALNDGKYNSDGFGTIICANEAKTFNVIFTNKQLQKLKLCNIDVYENLPHLFDSNEGYVTKHYGINNTFNIFRSRIELNHSSKYDKVLDFIMSNTEEVTTDMD